MKKLFMLIALGTASFLAPAQSCEKPCDKPCDKSCQASCTQTCAPKGTKTAEARAITRLRSNLEAVMVKMSQSALAFDKAVLSGKIAKGSTEEESLLLISQAAEAIHQQLTSKLESTQLIASLKNHQAPAALDKQQTVTSLKREIEVLAAQARRF